MKRTMAAATSALFTRADRLARRDTHHAAPSRRTRRQAVETATEADVLHAAARLLTERTLHRGDLYPRTDPNVNLDLCPVDVVGAIAYTVYGVPSPTLAPEPSPDRDDLYTLTLEYLADWLLISPATATLTAALSHWSDQMVTDLVVDTLRDAADAHRHRERTRP